VFASRRGSISGWQNQTITDGKRFLEKLVVRLDEEPSAALCYCRSRRISNGRDRWLLEFFPLLSGYHIPVRREPVSDAFRALL
jgi:hypothetical protein